jgi:hypothetical protein
VFELIGVPIPLTLAAQVVTTQPQPERKTAGQSSIQPAKIT